jgi:hypothetical protein
MRNKRTDRTASGTVFATALRTTSKQAASSCRLGGKLVDIAIGRRAGTESDAALNSMERLLRRAVRF